MRCRPALKAKLKAAAFANNRSVSEEVETRVEQSFFLEHLISALTMFGRRYDAAVDGRATADTLIELYAICEAVLSVRDEGRREAAE